MSPNEALLSAARLRVARLDDHCTHWAGCEVEHLRCLILKLVEEVERLAGRRA